MNLKGFMALVAFAMLLSNSAFGSASTPPGVSTQSMGYAPAETCAQCHQGQTEAWSHSDHAWAMKPAAEGVVLGSFDDTVFDDGASSAEFFRRGKDYWVKIEGEEGVETEFRIAYTFGHYPLQQYLVELSRGRLQALTIAWDSRPAKEGGQRWFSLYPDMSFEPGDSLHWTGRNQNWNAMCADCHSTYLTMNYDAEADSFATAWQEQNVGCQGCHGPGEKHVGWARANKADRKEQTTTAGDMGLLVDFGEMAPDKVVETCAYCHSRRQSIQDGQHAHEDYYDKALPAILMPDLYHADGQIQGEVYVYGSFIQSKMAKAGVTCLDCHDPHTAKLKIEGNGLCLQCHNQAPQERFPTLKASNYNTEEHHKHPESSEGAQCVNCHMPDETYMVVDPRRDHSFRIPRPDLTVTTGSPNACTSCHEDKSAEWAVSMLQKWYPNSKRPSHFADTLQAFRAAEDDAMNRLGELIRDTSQPAIARATAAEHLSTYGSQAVFFLRSGLFADDPLVRAYSAGAFAQIPADGDLKVLMGLLGPDQPKAVQDQVLSALAGADLSGLTAGERKRFNELDKNYQQRLESLSALPGSRFNWANYLRRTGNTEEAIRQYQKSLKLDAVFSPARVSLATLASQVGKQALAVETLRVGSKLEQIPDTDRGYIAYLLALVLVEQGQEAEALGSFELAVKLNPENPRAAYNYGLILTRGKQWEEASRVLRAGLQAHPADYNLLNALAHLYLQKGEPKQALGFAQQMLELYPSDPYSRRLVRQLEMR